MPRSPAALCSMRPDRHVKAERRGSTICAIQVTLLDATHPSWGSELERFGVELGPGHNPKLFPYHFLFVTLSKIGGKIADFAQDGRRIGVGSLFPRGVVPADPRQRVYTLRYYSLRGAPALEDPGAMATACSTALAGAQVVFYDPYGTHTFTPTHELIGPVDLGSPDAEEAEAIRTLQSAVWGSPAEFLYPSDIHSREFGPGSSLVARVEGTLAAFLLGFYKFGGGRLPADWPTRFGGDFRLESQTMGVLPAYRGLRIANLLKRTQAQRAVDDGISIINWTADPLQFPNAALNFGLLRAVAFDFAPDLYPFRNELNRVRASRVSLTWLIHTERVANAPLVGTSAQIVDLRHRLQIQRVNDGCSSAEFAADAEIIAIEIPLDWTGLQRLDLALAQRWREVTDQLFAHYIGIEPDQYVITGVGTDESRRYLLAERATPRLWDRLSR